MLHVRLLDADGFTITQSTRGFHTPEAAKEYADLMGRKTGEIHTVCESIDDKDPRNNKADGKRGFVPYVGE